MIRKYKIYSIDNNMLIGYKKINKPNINDYFTFNVIPKWYKDKKLITLVKIEKIINKTIFVKLTDYAELTRKEGD